ncbi:MAG: hypothetical protein COA52_03480 [Hyphomicrobiales bacterium]|nr:MAG: hypothetical protein COA52_03480 [Hyphomicrobiales bacterium]
MSNSFSLEMPHILPSQAQKHVTHNEAIDLLDAIVQLAVINRSLSVPPAVPVSGERYLVATGASGDWASHDNEFALFLDGGWLFRTPREGWRTWVESEQILLVLAAGGWQEVGGAPAPQNAIINGGFDIWQRGLGPISGGNAGIYGADRWKMFSTGTASITMSRDPAVPNGLVSQSAYCQIAGVSPLDQVVVKQIVEQGDRLIAAGDVALSFWLRGPTGANISFGVDASLITHICSGGWEQVSTSFTGLVPLANGTCEITLLSDISLDGGYNITAVQLVSGPSAGTYQSRPAGTEETLCRRYFERLGGGDRQLGRTQNAFGAQVSLHPMVAWSTPKRTIPTVSVLGDINDGPQQSLGLHHVSTTHAIIDQQVPAFGWLDIDEMDVDAEF